MSLAHIVQKSLCKITYSGLRAQSGFGFLEAAWAFRPGASIKHLSAQLAVDAGRLLGLYFFLRATT
jgi:hypothetical protein